MSGERIVLLDSAIRILTRSQSTTPIGVPLLPCGGGRREGALAKGALSQMPRPGRPVGCRGCAALPGASHPLSTAPSPPSPLPQGGRGTLAAILAGLTSVLLAIPAAAQDEAAPDPAVDRYVELCGMCHREDGMGTGLLARRLPAEQARLERRDDLTAGFVEAVVRTGAGNMPPLSRAEVSDDALAAIAAYLAAGPHDGEGGE